ncbi:hypothetical protein [Bacillus solimangrovi]|uniref:Uncharacterized protein n=1 Tax=Bacillus solimangrovi TaxID=1305675 RepID=A0A1E5LIE8_9BACI|nr:hypothetical protein [Bacillus solimangrovi]OEH93841.1 hypothetical protein BFG57_11005 [Bacillus solimangrovi]
MKKYKIILLVAIVLTLGICTFMIYEKTFKPTSQSMGLTKIYKTVSEISNDSELVIKASISNHYEENERYLSSDQKKEERIYDVEIITIYQNLTSKEIAEGDVIRLAHTVEIYINEQPISQIEGFGIDIKEGHYLLFLNSYTDKNTGEVVYVQNPKHMYKKTWWKFRNIASKELPKISEKEVMDAIK